MHSGKKIAFVFENSSAHNSLVKDALSVSKMNVNPGRKNVPSMCSTIISSSNLFGLRGQVQIDRVS